MNTLFTMALGAIALTSLALSSCATTPDPVCASLRNQTLTTAFDSARRELAGGCVNHFDRYLGELLVLGEGDPDPDNKRQFSEFLVWASDNAILSTRQARERYNRYFNVKFVSLIGDYNNCAYTCPRQDVVIANMQRELADKELGLMRVAADRESYYRADRLLQETELVLAATCTACAEAR